MNINFTKETLNRIKDNPNQTELERILANYTLRCIHRIGKEENEKNELKQILKSIAARFFSSCPWILEQEAKNHEYTVTTAHQNETESVNEPSNTQD